MAVVAYVEYGHMQLRVTRNVTTILLIDQHGVFRTGLRSVLDARIPRVIVCEGSCLESLRNHIGCALVLIDSESLPRCSVEKLRRDFNVPASTHFAVMSSSNRRSDVFDFLAAGFHGFIFKMQSDNELVTAVSDMLSGRIYVPRWLCDEDENVSRTTEGSRNVRLTPRQDEILMLLANGTSNKEIARLLNVAEGTIKIHIAALLRALGARNRTEAAFKAANISRAPIDHHLDLDATVGNGIKMSVGVPERTRSSRKH